MADKSNDLPPSSNEESTSKSGISNTRSKNRQSLRIAEKYVQSALRHLVMACDETGALETGSGAAPLNTVAGTHWTEQTAGQLHHLCEHGVLDTCWPYLEHALALSSSRTTPPPPPPQPAAPAAAVGQKHLAPTASAAAGGRGAGTHQSPVARVATSNGRQLRKSNSVGSGGGGGGGGGDIDIAIQVIDRERVDVSTVTVLHCAKRQLLQHMPYFGSLVRASELEHVDISVHCELAVFSWLVQWMRRQRSPAADPAGHGTRHRTLPRQCSADCAVTAGSGAPLNMSRGQISSPLDDTGYRDSRTLTGAAGRSTEIQRPSGNADDAVTTVTDDSVPPLPLLLSVLSAAEFLLMTPLVDRCLVAAAAQLPQLMPTEGATCLSDSLASRLGQMIGHRQLEPPTLATDVTDCEPVTSAGKARSSADPDWGHSGPALKRCLREQLYHKLVQQLCGGQLCAERGRYATASGLFACRQCHQLLTPAAAAQLACSGPGHVRLPGWRLCQLVARLRAQLGGSWRLVYWQLWASCHWLQCGRCRRPFPLDQWNNCRYHARQAELDTSSSSSSSSNNASGASAASGDGVYPCCGVRVLISDSSPQRDGCCHQDHQPTDNVQQNRVLAEFNTYRHLVTLACTKGAVSQMVDTAEPTEFRDSLLPVFVTGQKEADSGEAGKAEQQQQQEEEASGNQAGTPAAAAGGGGGDARRNGGALSRWSVSVESSEPDSTATGRTASGANDTGEEECQRVAARGRLLATDGQRSGWLSRPVPAPLDRQQPLWHEQRSARHNQHVQRRRERAEMRRLIVALSRPQAPLPTAAHRTGGSFAALLKDFAERHGDNVREKRTRTRRRRSCNDK